MKAILVVGTADTKGEELAYLGAAVAEAGGRPVLVDIGIGQPTIAVDVANTAVIASLGDGRGLPVHGDRGAAVAAMAAAFEAFLVRYPDLGGVIGIGGGGGTSIITAGMRGLGIGVPKLMVSTLASGDVGAYVDISDIAMMPAVTDLAGLNRISRVILRNAGFAIAGMVRAASSDVTASAGAALPPIGLTMFGVTTPCVTAVVERLRARFDCLVFHATGAGGRTMEKLVDSGLLTGVIDVTTTEVCDHLVGGVLSAGPDRLGAVARTGLPYVGSVGALDMVNFHGFDTVPERFSARILYRHNAQVTLMRTSADECRAIGAWIAERLNRCAGPVRFLIPERGVSMLDAPGQPFHDPEADAALFEAIEATLRPEAHRRLVRLPLHINDAAFAEALVDHFLAIAA